MPIRLYQILQSIFVLFLSNKFSSNVKHYYTSCSLSMTNAKYTRVVFCFVSHRTHETDTSPLFPEAEFITETSQTKTTIDLKREK